MGADIEVERSYLAIGLGAAILHFGAAYLYQLFDRTQEGRDHEERRMPSV